MAKNKLLEEQRRAHEEFLRLKRMENGEEKTEPKPSEISQKPQGFNEKRKNFWYHYKWHTIAAVVLVGVAIFAIWETATRERYDLNIVYFSFQAVLDGQLSEIEEYAEGIVSDIDQNGEVSVDVINCSFDGNSESEYKSVIISKLQTMLYADDSVVMYIMDDRAEEFIRTAAKGENIFEKEPVLIGEEFYKACESETYGSLPKGLMVGNRKIDGSLFDKNKYAEEMLEQCNKLLSKMVE